MAEKWKRHEAAYLLTQDGDFWIFLGIYIICCHIYIFERTQISAFLKDFLQDLKVS